MVYMRDSLALTVFALTYKSEALVAWQAEGLHSDGLEEEVKEE